MPGKLLPAHHTLADWDFESGSAYRSLSATYYVSAPTSLKILKPTGSWSEEVLCRIPATLCLPQGEVRTWFRYKYASYMPCSFRNQKALGSADHRNCYDVYLTATTAQLRRFINGGLSVRDSTPCVTLTDAWNHYRFFWYNGETPGEVPALCVDVYRDVAGEWIKQGSTLYDTSNWYKDSATNRCGIRPSSYAPNSSYYDDTEIWGPV
ncbi:unnamed protein product [marine sediment metagenome]|uniref:Uncharacterized protein n=1 Tax=marine sediment metagenome TaxID=412755 RepID=X1SQD3_9ZZZZ